MQKQVNFSLSTYLAGKESRNLISSQRHWEVKGPKEIVLYGRKSSSAFMDCMGKASRVEKS